jgi:hypothetical protein
MKTKFHLIAFLLIINVTSCKQENAFKDFKFSEKPSKLVCNNLNNMLYNEALYSFEQDITNFYSKDKRSLLSAYSQFIRLTNYNRVKYRDIASEHTLKVFEALKNEPELWDANNSNSHLNYNSPLMNCVSDNISDKDLKTTLKALLSTNSMSPRLFAPPLLSNYGLTMGDKYLASYVAFDLFYAKLFDVDFSIIEKEKPKVDFNLTK